ncbi:MAG: flavodoxin family protein [Actinomycetota bacterium]
MTRLSLIFHSGFGHTARAADAVRRGAERVDGVDVEAFEITAAQIDPEHGWGDEEVLEALTASDGIVFGAATYMGMVSWQFKAFAYATGRFWMTNGWQDKIAGGFTASSFPAGDKSSTIDYLSTLAAQLRMVWVGPAAPSSNLTQDGRGIDPFGYYKGVGLLGGRPDAELPTAGDLLTAELYGTRLAEATVRWTVGVPTPG